MDLVANLRAGFKDNALLGVQTSKALTSLECTVLKTICDTTNRKEVGVVPMGSLGGMSGQAEDRYIKRLLHRITLELKILVVFQLPSAVEPLVTFFGERVTTPEELMASDAMLRRASTSIAAAGDNRVEV